ncbi:MAG TPA: hypothetical protein DCL66_01865 [Gammaproteobacteria bacterium]|nr:hypothetical protein [Gammaproteobacteria bacterium]
MSIEKLQRLILKSSGLHFHRIGLLATQKELLVNHLKENNNSKDADVDCVIVGSGFRSKIEMGLVVPS